RAWVPVAAAAVGTKRLLRDLVPRRVRAGGKTGVVAALHDVQPLRRGRRGSACDALGRSVRGGRARARDEEDRSGRPDTVSAGGAVDTDRGGFAVGRARDRSGGVRRTPDRMGLRHRDGGWPRGLVAV